MTISAQLGVAHQIGLAFDPLEPRDHRGRWVKGSAGPLLAPTISHSPEGFSVRPDTGAAPTTGYMVSLPGHTHQFPASVMNDEHALAEAIDHALMSEREAYSRPGVYLGGWVSDGKLWLDPSENITSHDEAISAGRRRDQVAIWDVVNEREIGTGGSGGEITEHTSGVPGRPGGLPRTAGGRAEGGGAETRPPAPGTISAQLDLTGDGHGHHIPGTPMVYQHGFIPISAQAGDGSIIPEHDSLSEIAQITHG